MRPVGVDRSHGDAILEIGRIADGHRRVDLHVAVPRLHLELTLVAACDHHDDTGAPQAPQLLTERREAAAIDRGIVGTAQLRFNP